MRDEFPGQQQLMGSNFWLLETRGIHLSGRPIRLRSRSKLKCQVVFSRQIGCGAEVLYDVCNVTDKNIPINVFTSWEHKL